MQWDRESIGSALLCLTVATPLAYLFIRFHYRFALEHLESWRDREEARRQYRILVVALAITVLTFLTNTGFVGLPASVLLIYLSFRVLASKVSIIPASGLGPRGLKGHPLVPAIAYLFYAAILVLFAISPYIR